MGRERNWGVALVFEDLDGRINEGKQNPLVPEPLGELAPDPVAFEAYRAPIEPPREACPTPPAAAPPNPWLKMSALPLKTASNCLVLDGSGALYDDKSSL